VALFPAAFIEDLRTRANVVQVIQEYVPLKKSGATYKGLCPFHGEKTPSFHVNPEKGFFHCFGCGVGGDVFKFLELHEKLGFVEAVRLLAKKFGMTVPDVAVDGDEASARERETLIKIHEVAGAWFRQQLAGPDGARARDQLNARAIKAETVETLGLGFAPVSREALKGHLLKQGFSLPLLVRSGLLVEREGGQTVDRFRGRLIVPIARDTGTVVAFAGRAMEADQVPKYLNSPETPIYSKSRTVYGLSVTKPLIRKAGFVVLVEGYFDFAQVMQESRVPVVATCGTALTTQQAQILRRFASKIVLSYDPDAAGQGAATRSSELLVREGFQVNVAVLPGGDDPDSFIRKHGGKRYAAELQQSKPYLEFLLDRTAGAHDLKHDEGRFAFLQEMLAVSSWIPEAAARDQFADRIAHRARITESVVRAEIRKAAVERRADVAPSALPPLGQLKPAERGLLWALVNQPDEAVTALGGLEPEDLDVLSAPHVVELARGLWEGAGSYSPSALLERLSTEEAQLVTRIAADVTPPAPALECLRAVKRLRLEREGAAVQRAIDRIQEAGEASGAGEIDHLWQQKRELLQRIEALGMSSS
jgi:DNA primase